MRSRWHLSLIRSTPTLTIGVSAAAAVARCLLASVLLSLLFTAAASAAPPSRRDPPGYKRAVDAGVDEFDRGNFDEAREHFTRAHALFPNARTLRGLGMSEFELRNYVEAVEKLEAALASSEKRLEGKLREETAALLARARVYVGEVQLTLSPDTTELHVDGFPATPGPEGRLRLAVGDHALEFSAPGYKTDRRAITVLGEQTLHLDVRLALPESPKLELQVQPAPTAPVRHEHPWKRPRPSTNAGGSGPPSA